ncbi:hypothetical protein [Deinococcus pimensis]|uniref:hypothetical protein n=1 Tax=Deinococcus pimensis TaxID=309888 RepID=UPI0005EB0E30|nr:hypothetical protein [Deinococcus pimensis]
MTVALLHTSSVHVPTFDALFSEIAPGLLLRHFTREHLLDLAVKQSDRPALVAGAVRAVVTEAACAASIVLCTCSTIGAYAESTQGVRVVRVDRPMSRHAVRTAERVHVIATLRDALPATLSLLHEEATQVGHDVRVTSSVVPDAWSTFLSGHLDDYLDQVARHVESVAGTVDVVVLAQASMAGSLALLNIETPVLTSPRLAVREVVRLVGPEGPYEVTAHGSL